MKKVINLLSAVFLTGAAFAQNDTMPTKGNQPAYNRDTVPSLRSDTTPSWRRDTINWNKDSMKTKKWNDTLGKQELDTLSNGLNGSHNRIDQHDSLRSSNPNWQDTASSIGNKKQQDSSAVAGENKSKANDANGKSSTRNQGDSSTATTKIKKVVTDRVMMKEGEMVVIKKGKETKLESTITLPDGNKIAPDGTVKMPDGNSVKLKDGEYISLVPKKNAPTKKAKG